MPPARFGVALLALVAVAAASAPRPAAGELPSHVRARDPRVGEARSLVERADRARGDGRLEEAESLYLEAVAAIDGATGPTMLLARAVDGLGDLCRAQRRFDAAAGYYVRAAELWEPLLGPEQPRLATTLHNLGVVYLETERLDAAEPALRRALSIWEKSLGAGSDQAELTRRAMERLAALRVEPRESTAQGASVTGNP
jgi:tetratricopeptide (TPR) repeat protein